MAASAGIEEPQRSNISRHQLRHANTDLGLPRECSVVPSIEKLTQARINSEDPHCFEKSCSDYHSYTDWLLDNDLILFRAGHQNLDRPVLAYQHLNIITLQPLVFTENFTDCLSCHRLEPGVTQLQDLASQARCRVVCHELMHSQSVLCGKY